MHNIKFAVQNYGLLKEYNHNVDATILEIKETGFHGVEPFLLFMNRQGPIPKNMWTFRMLKETTEKMKGLGLEIPSIHIGIGMGGRKVDIQKVTAGIRKAYDITGCKLYVVSGMFHNASDARKWADIVNAIGKEIAEFDAKIVYHNHSQEFTEIEVEGRKMYVLDYFFSLLKVNVLLELDIGWSAFAGDEVEIFNRYRDRIVELHCKDFTREGLALTDQRMVSANAFAAIGDGTVRTKQIISLIADDMTAFNGYIIIDQDKTTGNMMDDLKTGYKNLVSFTEEASFDIQKICQKFNMEKERLSLMTFPMIMDYKMKRFSIKETFELCRKASLKSIDVMNVEPKEINEYVKYAAEYNIDIYCYIANISFFKEKANIDYNLQTEMAKAKKLGAKLFMIVPYKPIVDKKSIASLSKNEIREYLIKGFRTAVSIGKEYGLKVCFETTPHERLHLSGNEDCRYILDAVDDLGFVFDTANMLSHGDEPLSGVELLFDRTCHIHLKDVVVLDKKYKNIEQEFTKEGNVFKACIWGEGIIPIQKFYDKFNEAGYKEKFAIEYVHPPKYPANKIMHEITLKRFLS